GRLMCCLRYEHEFYVQSRKRFPKEGKILTTSVGEERVLANDIFRDTVTLRNVEGDTRVVALAGLKREIAEASGAAHGDDAAENDGRQLDGRDAETHKSGASRALPMHPGSNRMAPAVDAGNVRDVAE